MVVIGTVHQSGQRWFDAAVVLVLATVGIVLVLLLQKASIAPHNLALVFRVLVRWPGHVSMAECGR